MPSCLPSLVPLPVIMFTMATAPNLNPRPWPCLPPPRKTPPQNPSGKAERQRAQDNISTDSVYPPPSHPHPYKRTVSTPTYSFRTSPTEQPQTLSVVCLYRPHPNMGECFNEMLSDGEPAFSTQRKLDHLVDRQGKYPLTSRLVIVMTPNCDPRKLQSHLPTSATVEMEKGLSQ
jgi:hypothetical protein